MVDDGFHEIQVGKKQLVFFFMASAVFVVVVFLMGVWVGRDVRRPETEIMADVPTADVTPDTPQPPTQVSPSELDYTARLQGGSAATDTKPGEPAKPTEPPTPAAESAPEPTPDAKKTASEQAAPVASAFYVQVAAFGTKKPADTLMAGLKKKGYAAYVVTEPSGPTRFRVRVGPFADRAAAEEASARLKKEEGLSPLVRR